MSEQSCRVCGCTDRCGCPEGCHWVEPDLCSVCSGATKKRRRSYTRTSAATGDWYHVPAGTLAIFNPVGRIVGYAWHISEAQAMARGIDNYYAALAAGNDVATGHPLRRGPIARRPRTVSQ
jgi:hypothetical protein